MAQNVAHLIAQNGPLVVRATKRIIAEQSGWTDAEAFERQRAIAAPVMTSADAKEGIQAYVEKRAARFEGK
mgnify:CR=1 FL=1